MEDRIENPIRRLFLITHQKKANWVKAGVKSRKRIDWFHGDRKNNYKFSIWNTQRKKEVRQMQANSTLNDKVEIRSRHNLRDQTRAEKERILLRGKHPQAITDSGNNNN